MTQNVENAGQGSADGVAPETDIVVTPEMIEAGLGELMQFSRSGDVYEDRVRSIYEAMVRASRKVP